MAWARSTWSNVTGLKVLSLLLLCSCLLAFAKSSSAESRGVIDDPAGHVEVRAEKRVDAEITATLKAAEPFAFECAADTEWCKVTLASGESGWVQNTSIRLHFTEKDLPVREKSAEGLSEIDQFARWQGFDYASVTRRAARGDTKALKQFFSLAEHADGAAAESISGMPTVVYHLLGDAKFAAFLNAQPVPERMTIRNRILGDRVVPAADGYFRRHFPETTKALFRREIVDWFSPDGLYAIRKVFSDEFDLGGSKVVRAEIIERKSGRVLCDLTPDDIGTDAQREGEALWSPDSRRVACLSSNLPVSQGNLFSAPRAALLRKQTAVYQRSGDTFTHVDLSLGEPAGRDKDLELQDAILGHEFTEPLRWVKPNVLLLQRHEYYEKLKPVTTGGSIFNTIYSFGRLYRITATIGADTKASVAWKLQPDRP